MTLAIGHKHNFETLREAISAGDAALLECQLTATGETVPVICAANRLPDGGVEFVPLAMQFNDDPYTIVNPPNPDGGFHSQDEVREPVPD